MDVVSDLPADVTVALSFHGLNDGLVTCTGTEIRAAVPVAASMTVPVNEVAEQSVTVTGGPATKSVGVPH